MGVRVIADGLGFTEGPVALPDGSVALTSINEGAVFVVDPGGAVRRIDVGGGANGLAAGPDGALYVAQNGGAWGGSGPAPAGVQVIRDGKVEYLVEGLGAPNDVEIGPDGRLWVTDTVAEFPWGEFDLAQPGQVLAVDVASGAREVVVEQGPLFTNGLAFSADGTELLVTATLPAQLLGYPLTGGRAGDPRLVVQFTDGAQPDGMTRDGESYWVALLAGDRVDRVAADGTPLDSRALPQGSLPTNVCLDHDGSGLFVTCGFGQSVVHVTTS